MTDCFISWLIVECRRSRVQVYRKSTSPRALQQWVYCSLHLSWNGTKLMCTVSHEMAPQDQGGKTPLSLRKKRKGIRAWLNSALLWQQKTAKHILLTHNPPLLALENSELLFVSLTCQRKVWEHEKYKAERKQTWPQRFGQNVEEKPGQGVKEDGK